MPTDFGFAGQRRDASAGLMYYGARYYDAGLGRFISADTIVPSAGNPQSLNRYAYVYNNPLRYIDPTGHECRPAGKGVWCTDYTPMDTTALHVALDVAGLVDPTPLSDGTNALIYAVEGNWEDAGLSAIAIVPVVGDVIGKGAKAVKYAAKAAKYADEAIAVAKTIEKYGIKPFDKLVRPLARAGDAGHHLVEKRFWRQLGFSSADEGKRKILAIEIGGTIHGPQGKGKLTITDQLRDAINYGLSEDSSLQKIWEVHRDTYRSHGYDDWAEVIWATYFKDKGLTK